MPRKAENLLGQQFGTRRVVARAKTRDYAGYKTIYWKTVCTVCGHKTEVQGSSLRRGIGCRQCWQGAPALQPSRPGANEPGASRTVLAKHRRAMTVGQLMALLAELPARAQIRVRLVSREGHATRTLKDVSTAGNYVLLVTELPHKLEPWRG